MIEVEKLPSDTEGMEATMEYLLALIDDTYKYVDYVVNIMYSEFFKRVVLRQITLSEDLYQKLYHLFQRCPHLLLISLSMIVCRINCCCCTYQALQGPNSTLQKN